MKNNPKKLNLTDTPTKNYPGQILHDGLTPTVGDLLPPVFQTTQNKKLLDGIIENLFQPASLETIASTVGRKTLSNSNDNVLTRSFYSNRQLEAGLLRFKEDTVDTLSANDISGFYNFNNVEPAAAINILDLPIDPDKFINWADYYWLSVRTPILFLSNNNADINIPNDIIGKQYYCIPEQTNGRDLQFKNGMRVSFQKSRNVECNLTGDFSVTLIRGTGDDIVAGFESFNYNKSMIQIDVDGLRKTNFVDYVVLGNVIRWLAPVESGSVVDLVAKDYYITKTDDTLPRVWLVQGVGTENGIKLLGATYQNTNTIYSNTDSLLWDQNLIPWDRLEWDGIITGVNAKHYILQESGAENRNAHSRVNVWLHKDTIQTVADFLAIDFSELVDESDRAVRPIVEFENTLELFNHGSKFRDWVHAVEKDVINPNDYVGIPTRYLNIQLGLATESTADNAILRTVSLLWQTTDSGYYKNKIIIFYSVNNIVTGFHTITLNENETIVVASPKTAEKFIEYYCKDSLVIPASYRNSITDQPLFKLYNNDHISFDKFEEIYGFNPTLINSKIIEIKNGTTVDSESGYNLEFLQTQFTQLSQGNVAANQIYNIVYKHTQHTPVEYIDADGNTRAMLGPYSFRRITNKPLAEELSNGYQKAWFKLRSWTSQTIQLTDASQNIAFDMSMWPKYEWAVKLTNGLPTIVHPDTFENVIHNRAVGAFDEEIKFDLYGDTDYSNAVITGEGMPQYNAEIINNKLSFYIPTNCPNVITVTVDSTLVFKIRVINVKNDPRFIKLSLNGNAIDYYITGKSLSETDNKFFIQIDNTGLLEISHQGGVPLLSNTAHHVTSLPGLELNPFQDPNLGEFCVSTLVKGLSQSIDINKHDNTRAWTYGPAIKSMDGIYMAEDSAIRSSWAKIKLEPSLQDCTIARSSSSWRWHRRFIAKINEHAELYDLDSTSAQFNLDRILSELSLGITINSSDAISGMAFPTSKMNLVTHIATAGQAEFDILTKDNTAIYLDEFSPDHIYVYVDGTLLSSYGIDAENKKIVFGDSAIDAGTKVEIFHAAAESIYCGIPASPSKLGLQATYLPRGQFNRFTNSEPINFSLRRHDGSLTAYYVDPATGRQSNTLATSKILIELETRIFIGCVNKVGEENRPYAFNNRLRKPLTDSQFRAQTEWYAINNIDLHDRSDYVSTDPWTWNYNGVSASGMYLQKFGTLELHNAPWKALGFDFSPIWWHQNYSWTDSEKRTNLENALRHGIISDPAQPVITDPEVCFKFETFPVNMSAELIHPVEWGIASPSADDARAPWTIGSIGPMELLWLNSPAGAWNDVLNSADGYLTSNNFIDSNINPFVKNLNNSVKAKGNGSIAPDNFLQARPTIGIGALLFEAYKEFNLIGDSPVIELSTIDTKLQFALGGFTPGDISMKLNYTKYQEDKHIPAEDFIVAMSTGIPTQWFRYTSVKIERDGVGFRVFGFDPIYKYFTIQRPSEHALSLNWPNLRRELITPNGTFTEYLEWGESAIVHYGTYIANKQDLITFLMGLGAGQGVGTTILPDIDSRGVIVDWKQASIDALTWIDQNWGTDHVCVVGIVTANGIKIRNSKGSLVDLSLQIGKNNVILLNNEISQNDHIEVTRNYQPGVDKVSMTNDKQIVFVNFQTRMYDHTIVVNNKTRFGENIVNFQTGNRVNSIEVFGKRTSNWTGRPSAPGILPHSSGALPGFETLVNDIVHSHMSEGSAFDSTKTALAWNDVLPEDNSIVSKLINDTTTAHLFKQGLQATAGTTSAIESFFRNSNLDALGALQDISVQEQWLFKLGEFGHTPSHKVWEFELHKKDITTDRQIIRFANELSPEDYKNNIIDLYGANDKRWISRPANLNFDTIARDQIDKKYSQLHNWLPSAGIANLVNTDIQLLTFDRLDLNMFRTLTDSLPGDIVISPSVLFTTIGYKIFNDYQVGDFTWEQGYLWRANEKITGSEINAFDSTKWTQVTSIDGTLLPSIWISDYNGNGWMVIQVVSPQYIEEICPNALNPESNQSKVTFAAAHLLSVGDNIIITATGDGSIDRLHKVEEIVDDYNVLIAARSSTDQICYNAVMFKFAKVKFNTDAEWQASTLSFLPGMSAYIDYGDTEGSYKIVNYVEDGSDVGSAADVITKYSGPMVDTANILKAQLFDYETRNLLASIEIYDPYKGLTIDNAAKEIDYRQGNDPAIYNVDDLGQLDEFVSENWAQQRVGELWWDTSKVRYIEYEQSDDIQYRARHWGEKFANSEVAVYEWVESSSIPDITDSTITLDASNGLPGQVRFSIGQKIDAFTNSTEISYYFWRRYVNILPRNSNRLYSAATIESVLNDPNANGITWLSPITANSLLISNFNSFFANREKCILRIEQNLKAEQIYSNNLLVSEGYNGDVIDEYLYQRLKVSVVGHDNYRETYPIKNYVAGTAYAKGDYICKFNNGKIINSVNYAAPEYPILKQINDTRDDIEYTWQSKDGADHKIYTALRNFTATNLQNDVNNFKLKRSPASGLIKDLFEFDTDRFYAVLDIHRRVPNMKLHELVRHGNQYVPHTQSWYKNITNARQTLVSAANDSLLKINVVNKVDWDKHLVVYKPLGGFSINDAGQYVSIEKDLTIYWEYVDYVAVDYVPGYESIRLQSLSEVDKDNTDITNFAIVDANNNLLESYNKDGNNITLVYQKNGTIQLLDNIWDGSAGDAWDRARWDNAAWDEDASHIVGNIMQALREDVFVGEHIGYFNLLFFTMVKESLVQIPAADWVIKSTYLDIMQTNNNTTELIPIFKTKNDALIKEYINTVKPYHSKISKFGLVDSTKIEVGVETIESIRLIINNVETSLPELN